MESTNDLLNSAVQFQEIVAKALYECLDNDNIINTHISTIKNNIKEYAELAEEFKYSEKIFVEAKEECTMKNTANLEEIYNNKLKKQPSFHVEDNHRFLKTFNAIVKENRDADPNDPSICEVSVTQQATITDQIIDPITKRPIINGIKNKLCNHIYEKDSIMPLFSKNKSILCPYIGCVRKNHKFTKKDLTEDFDLLTQATELNELQDLVDETVLNSDEESE